MPYSCVIECLCIKMFIRNVLDWFIQVNVCRISPTTAELTASILDTTKTRKFNSTAFFMPGHIHLGLYQ